MHTLKNGARLGDYAIVRLIARGGMGEVYEAIDMRLDRRIALKVIAHELQEREGSDLIRRFLQEARLLAKVNHPNIVTVHSIDSVNGTQFIAMEYVEGVALREFLRVQAFPVEVAVTIFEQMLNGLKCLHDNKIIHRDIKPGNVLVRADSQIKILDFGIASSLDRRGNTDPGFIVGTPNYMAPELRQGAAATPRSDFWALGAMFFECLTGRPFAQAVKNSRGSPFNSDHGFIPVELRSLITCMTATNPDERYANADQILSDLRALRRTIQPASDLVASTIGKKIQSMIDESRPSDEEAKAPAAKLTQTTVMVARMKEPSKVVTEKKVEFQPMPPPVSPPSAPTPRYESRHESSQEKDANLPPLPRRKRRQNNTNLLPLVGGAVAALAVIAFLADILKDPHASPKQQTPPIGVNPPAIPAPPVVASSTKERPALLEPSDTQWLWMEPGKNPTFIWSRGVNLGEFKIQIASDDAFRKLAIEEGVSNNWYLPVVELPEGSYFWRLVPVVGSTAGDVHPRSFLLSRTRPVRLVKPESGFETRAAEPIEFEWLCKPLIERYQFQIASDQEFSRVLREERVNGCKWRTQGGAAGRYFWRVGVENPTDRRVLWSAEGSFTLTAPPVPIALPAPRKPRRERPVVERPSVETAERPVELAAPVILNAEQMRTLSEPRKGRGGASQPAEAQLELAWGPVRGARDYVVKVSRVRDFSSIASEITSRKTNVTWRANSPGVVYWRVVARGPNGQPGKMSSVGQVRVLAPPRTPAAKPPLPRALPPATKNPLAAPAPLSPDNGASAPSRNGRISIEFSWSPLPTAETYTLEVSDGEEFDHLIKTVTVPASKVLLEKLEVKGRVYWRVRANSQTQRSGWSKAVYIDVE